MLTDRVYLETRKIIRQVWHVMARSSPIVSTMLICSTLEIIKLLWRQKKKHWKEVN